MINKRIHYCWFGGAKKPEIVLRCIASWKYYLPEYEIIEWNEENFDINCNYYCKEAYERKKWAFVSDFVRLYVVYHYGGIYFDTDVEVIKNFDDLLNQDYFLGLEDIGRVNTGIGFGGVKGSKIIKALLDEYTGIHFFTEGKENTTVCSIYNTRALEKLGLIIKKETVSFKGGTVYSQEFFSPINMNTFLMKKTKKTYSIHHYTNSWMTPNQRRKKLLTRTFNVYILRPLVRMIKKICHIDQDRSIWTIWK